MAAEPMTGDWTIRVPAELMAELEAHLFPGDGDEHGAVVGASLLSTARGNRLLARRLFLARDRVDYVPGQRGYRMLTAAFVRDCSLECAEEGLAYLAVHCHGGRDQVGFSADDLASHERGYPALLDILDGPPVGGLVFARNAAAGDLWLPGHIRADLKHLEVIGRPARRLHAARPPRPQALDDRYDRQVRLFDDRGQVILAAQKVGIIGAGGAGSLLVEYLAHLGVGHLVVIDPDRIDRTNRPRVVGSLNRDTRPFLIHDWLPAPIRTAAERWRTSKVAIARRLAQKIQPGIKFDAIFGDVTQPAHANRLLDCDYLFLAADTMQARLVFNAIVHQYLIPGVQVGAKAQVDSGSGELLDLFTVVRPIIPGLGCLWCNGLIPPAKLQEEGTAPEQLARQRYVDDADVRAPSVITLNAVAASHAANDYLMSVTGLLEPAPLRWVKHYPREGEAAFETPRRDEACPECSAGIGRLGSGPLKHLPTRQ